MKRKPYEITTKGWIDPKWLDEARRRGATHIILLHDHWEWRGDLSFDSVGPVYVMPGEDVRAIADRIHAREWECVLSVYPMAEEPDWWSAHDDFIEEMEEREAAARVERFVAWVRSRWPDDPDYAVWWEKRLRGKS